jgi:hypothetical protein
MEGVAEDGVLLEFGRPREEATGVNQSGHARGTTYAPRS